ncbi:MAG: tRNA lysidine(34) synthetase TilS [Hyphomonadaceae bacterium]|nr:tRNA lysidine(34) synthetase TilS [Hyphomonadaceae bacterium]
MPLSSLPAPVRLPAHLPDSLVAKAAPTLRLSLRASGPLLVGVSGGGDSVALLHLMGVVAPDRLRIAAIVDHALRPESAAEAVAAADIAHGLGAEPVVLRLDWPHGERRSQEAARIARHAALANLARARGASVLYLGHTRDDQAETVLIRRQAGSGSFGLAAMSPLSPSPVWPEGRDLRIARPLLSVSREALRDHLRREGLHWIEDPSNEMLRYARVRARRELRDSAETEGLIEQALASTRLGMTLHGEARLAAGLFVRLEGSDAVVHAPLLDHKGGPIALAALAVAVGARTRDIPEEAGAGLLRRLRQDGHTALGGAIFVRKGEQIFVSRDPGGVHGRRGGGKPHPALTLAPGEPVVWDRRLELTAHAPGWTAARAPDGRSTAPVFLRDGSPQEPGEAVTARWLIDARMSHLLWRGISLPFR